MCRKLFDARVGRMRRVKRARRVAPSLTRPDVELIRVEFEYDASLPPAMNKPVVLSLDDYKPVECPNIAV